MVSCASHREVVDILDVPKEKKAQRRTSEFDKTQKPCIEKKIETEIVRKHEGGKGERTRKGEEDEAKDRGRGMANEGEGEGEGRGWGRTGNG